MSVLIFCSFELGGLPFKMAEILNKFGNECYYISIDKSAKGIQKAEYHYDIIKKWNLSALFEKKTKKNEIVELLKEIKNKYSINFCIATGFKSYYLHLADINYYYWTYGWDLDVQCFRFPYEDYSFPQVIIKLFYRVPYFYFVQRNIARNTIKAASAIMIAQYQKEALDIISSNKKLFFLPHFLEIKDFDETIKLKSKYKSKYRQLFSCDLYFFSPVRHDWFQRGKKFPPNTDDKGNNIVISAFAEFMKDYKTDLQIKLVLVDIGKDVIKSKELIHSFGLENHVIWLPRMSRSELEEIYLGSHICFGQFGVKVLSFALIEPLSLATPCISAIPSDEISIPFYDQRPPIFDYSNLKDISIICSKLIDDKSFYYEYSRLSWEWVKTNCSEERFVEVVNKLIKE